MCSQGGGIDWSSFGEEREKIRYETKLEFAELIQKKIDSISHEEKFNQFLAGLVYAKALIFEVDWHKPTDNNQFELF